MTDNAASDINALIASKDYEEAERRARALTEAAPDNAHFWDTFGVCLFFAGKFDESVAAYRTAIAKGNQQNAQTWYNLATSLHSAGQIEEAIAANRSSLAIRPDNESAKYNLSRALLLAGQWSEGWTLYEARGRKPEPIYQALSFERWQGEPPGRYLLVVATEQGIGDAIQFARFVPRLQAMGYLAVLVTDPRLVELLKDVQPSLQVGTAVRHGAHGTIKWVPLMSLPGFFGIRPDNITAAPYLQARPELIETWSRQLGADGFRIGIAWQGNPEGGIDAGRSFGLRQFAPLAALPGVHLISLQKGSGAEQLADAPFPVTTLGGNLDAGPNAFLDTAAVMTSLDLIVTADTATAHLAGALGRPVFVALQKTPDWRWLRDRPDTPWYPSMRLFRQTTRGDWGPVFAQITTAVVNEMRRAPTPQPARPKA